MLFEDFFLFLPLADILISQAEPFSNFGKQKGPKRNISVKLFWNQSTVLADDV